MAFKINISTSDGKTYKLEAEAPDLMQKSLGEIVQGQEISPDLAGYELQITGLSDKAGFTSMEEVQGFGLKKVLLKKGKAMHNRPKGDKKRVQTPNGLRLRKTVRGKIISDAIVQVNTKVLKEGGKKLSEIFQDQNKAPEPEAKPEEAAPAVEAEVKETPVETEVKETPQNTRPESEPKQALPTEGNPEEEPKQAPKAIEEMTHPDEEPKQ